MAWDLVEKHGFNPNATGPGTRAGQPALQYVIDGLKTQGCSPGLVVARSAIITSQEALTGGTDTCTLWASFARRGLGFSAVQGTTDRDDNQEAFDTHPDCREGFTAGVDAPYGSLNEAGAGDVVVVKFRADGTPTVEGAREQLAVLAQGRLLDLQVVSQDPTFITPREFPIATETQEIEAQAARRRPFRYRCRRRLGRDVPRVRPHAL